MSMINPLARARGLGSAKSGVHHWYAQRASALLLIVLFAWLIYAMIRLSGADHATASSFIANPTNAAFLVLLIVSLFSIGLATWTFSVVRGCFHSVKECYRKNRLLLAIMLLLDRKSVV